MSIVKLRGKIFSSVVGVINYLKAELNNFFPSLLTSIKINRSLQSSKERGKKWKSRKKRKHMAAI